MTNLQIQLRYRHAKSNSNRTDEPINYVLHNSNVILTQNTNPTETQDFVAECILKSPATRVLKYVRIYLLICRAYLYLLHCGNLRIHVMLLKYFRVQLMLK